MVSNRIDRRGFTLMELALVVGLMGVLVLFAAVRIVARDHQTINNITPLAGQ